MAGCKVSGQLSRRGSRLFVPDVVEEAGKNDEAEGRCMVTLRAPADILVVGSI